VNVKEQGYLLTYQVSHYMGVFSCTVSYGVKELSKLTGKDLTAALRGLLLIRMYFFLTDFFTGLLAQTLVFHFNGGF